MATYAPAGSHQRPTGARRTAACVACWALLSACAGDDAHARDLGDLREELHRQRQAQEELRVRLERLEGRAAVAGRPAPVSPVNPPAYDQLADLPVVRLEAPPAPVRRAPPLDTRVALREPTDEELAALAPVPGRDLGRALQKDDPAADASFAAAVRQFNGGERLAAADAFLAFVANNAEHPAADNALYLAGVAHAASGKCDEARPMFERILVDYADDDTEAPALLSLGQCDAARGRDAQARQWFERVLQQHPRTAEASQAEAALTELTSTTRGEPPPVAGRP